MVTVRLVDALDQFPAKSFETTLIFFSPSAKAEDVKDKVAPPALSLAVVSLLLMTR